MKTNRPLIALLTGSLSVLALVNCSDSIDTGTTPNGGSAGDAGGAEKGGAGGKSGSSSAGTKGEAGSAGAFAGMPEEEGGMGGMGGVAGMGGEPPVQGEAGVGGVSPEGGAAGDTDIPSGPHIGPILKYTFNEGAGTLVADVSGRGLDAKLTVAAWSAQGRTGAGLLLSGGLPPDAYVTVPPGVFTNVKETTVAAWVKVIVDAPWARIFDFGGQGLDAATRFMYLTPNTPAGMRFSVYGGDPTREAIVTTGTFLPLNVWKHVAVTAAVGGKHAIYIDGFPAAETSTVDVPPSELEPLSNQSWLGKSRFADPGLNGMLDDFTIYDRVLAPAEIATLADPKADYSRVAFDEAAGTTSADTSTRGVTATLNGGATWASGRLGAAVALSGVSQYVALANPIAGCTTELTIALWVKETAAANWARIFDFGGTNDNFMYLTPSGTDGKLQLSIHNSLAETVVLSTTSVPADSAWHHVAVVVSALTSTVYVDGVSVGSSPSLVTPATLGATNENWLGKSRFTADPYFTGAFDEVRISCRAFTPDEIKNLAFH